MYKYGQLKRFHHNFRLQVYIYAFMYVNTESILVEDYFPATKLFFEDHKKILTPGPVPKHCLRFIHICSEDYKLDMNFDEV